VSCLDIASARLSAHGVAHEFNVCQGNAHEDLVHYVRQHNYDLLFMGAFGHRRIIEWLLGSTTQYFLRMSPVPLVLCHVEQPTT
jgi:nucleotide-binding universal stress UspA family protein